MKKSQLKKRSKRKTLSDKYKVDKKIRDHHRKVRKEARKAKKNGLAVKSNTKLTRIPNIFPDKRGMLEEQDLMKEIEKNKKKNAMLTTQDLENLVEEEEGNKIIVDPENIKVKAKPKYDTKRELNMLIEKSDVIVEVLDARDPFLYRSKELEKKVLTVLKDKKLILLINKIDLVSKENSENWGKLFRRDIPTILFSTKTSENENSINELITTIKSLVPQTQNKKVHVGFVGYPNTGKSTLIKTLKAKFNSLVKSQAINTYNEIVVDNNIRLFDKPGYVLAKTEVGPLMPKTCKDVGELKSPVEVVKIILTQIPHEDLLEMYEISDFETHIEFLENIAKNKNYLIKKGYPDIERVARFVIGDVISGKIKYETPLEK